VQDQEADLRRRHLRLLGQRLVQLVDPFAMMSDLGGRQLLIAGVETLLAPAQLPTEVMSML
jgi:hypothetical protein